jgi:hypothetical protein
MQQASPKAGLTRAIKENTYTDYRLYSSIFYHIFGNALTFCPSDTLIEVENSFSAYSEKEHPNLTGCLITRISNVGIFRNKTLDYMNI